MSAPAPELSADLAAGLRRLKLAAMRRLAPELLVTAKTQRWSLEELLRTLVEAEVASRDASNAAARLKAARFPATKTLEEFDLSVSSIPRPTFADYLASLEWIRARENLCLVGPAGTGRSHCLVALGRAAVSTGRRVRYFSAADLVETLYRGLADNSVGRVIDQTLRAEAVLIDELGFAPLDNTGGQLLFRSVAAAYESRSASPATGRSRSGAASCPSTPPPPACSTGSCTTASSASPTASPTGCGSVGRRERGPRLTDEGGYFYLATSDDARDGH